MRPYPPGSTPIAAPTGTPATLAEARLVDARDTAASLLERYAREQDAAEAWGGGARRALATTRGEAASAAEALEALMPDDGSYASLSLGAMARLLRDRDPIPSATLTAWALRLRGAS